MKGYFPIIFFPEGKLFVLRGGDRLAHVVVERPT